MRRVLPVAAWIAGGAAVPAATLAAGVARLNDLPATDVAVVAAWLWLLFALLLAGPVAVAGVVIAALGRRYRHRDLGAVVCAGIFGALWMARIEPAHQMFSARPHVSVAGVIQLSLIALACVAIAAATRVAHPLRRWAAVAVVAAIVGAALLGVARWYEPTRDRTPFVTRLAPAAERRADTAGPPARVMVIGLDGLDWRPLERLIRAGQMPTMAGLIARGRSYQLDNRRMAVSPQIWTSIYTGRPEEVHGIRGFFQWRFAGASGPVAALPRFGAHPLWLVDAVLDGFDWTGGWETLPTTTLQMRTPAVWTIASAADRRVGVFSPAPHVVVGERVNGFFAWSSGDGFRISRRQADGSSTVEHLAATDPEVERLEGLVLERSRVALAGRLLREATPDLGVYYTHFVDSLSHENWDFRLQEGFLGGDPEAELDERFDATRIAAGYREIDSVVRDLIAAFGDGVVIVVSDHGWDHSDYEHFLSPYGVLVVANTGARGYGGVADVLSVAPTVLSLLGLPAEAGMLPPLDDVAASRGTADRRDRLRADYVIDQVVDPDLRQLLRSLGYLNGR